MEQQANQTPEIQAAIQEALKADKKKRSKRKWIIIAVIAVIIIFIVAVSGGGDDSGNNVSPAGSKVTTIQTAKEEAIKSGNVITTKYLKITYVSCNTNAKDYNKYATIPDGYKVIRADFAFENISDSDRVLNNIDCYADGTKCEPFYSGNDYKTPSLQNISAGRKTTAVVYYTVPTDAKEIELEMEDDTWSDTYIKFAVQ